MTRKQAVAAADKYFSLFIRARDKRCVTCGAQTSDCSHVFSRSHYSTRWDTRNAYGQCRPCHFKHHNQTESYLLDYARWRLGGENVLHALRTQWATVTKMTTAQIEEMARYYKGKVECRT